jgi:hypothetical protein
VTALLRKKTYRNFFLSVLASAALVLSLFSEVALAADLPQAPQNFVITGETASWSAPANEKTVLVLNYVIQYSYDGTNWENYTFPAYNETRKSVVSDLFSRKVYGYRIAAEGNNGRGEYAPVFKMPETASPSNAGVVALSTTGLAAKYGPTENVSYKIIGTPGDTCQIAYQNQTAKPFTIGASGSVTASFTTGTIASLILIKIDCTKSGSITARTELIIPVVSAPAPAPVVATVLPGNDASVNSVLTSIIEPLVGTCEEGELSVVRSDGLGFAQGDSVKALIYNYQGVELSTSVATKSAQKDDKDITFKMRVCQNDRAYTGVEQKYRLVMTYTDAASYFVQNQEYEFNLISRIELSSFYKYAAAQARDRCEFDQQSVQNSFIQSGVTRKAGEKMTIKGTLYRSGFASPNDSISLIKIVNSTSSKKVSTIKTDKEGNYSFTFTLETYPKAIFYRLSVGERTSDIGPVPGPFPAKEWDVFVDCKKGCKISEIGTSPAEPIVEFSKACQEGLAFFDLVSSQNDDENSKILRKVIIYPLISKIVKSRSETNAISAQQAADANAAAAAAAAAAAINNASKNSSSTSSSTTAKKSTSSGSSSASSGGGRCYVRGYTTKKGKRVSGYYRSC